MGPPGMARLATNHHQRDAGCEDSRRGSCSRGKALRCTDVCSGRFSRSREAGAIECVCKKNLFNVESVVLKRALHLVLYLN